VERRAREAVATFYTPELPPAPGEVSLGESAAHHAEVRRLSPGDWVRLTNGSGTIGMGPMRRRAKRDLVIDVQQVEELQPPTPLELLVPVADRDRMLWLAEKCTELGISVWQPVIFVRSRSVAPRGEGRAFAAKVRARMIGALEQSAGAWLPDIREEVGLDEAAARVSVPTRFMLDRSGRPLDPAASRDAVAVVFGPEGGMESAERERLAAGGWIPVTLAANTLRFETAGIAAVAILRAGASRVNGEG
jgi:16S rRNA (uracil1498-N3)-methyltransferase